MLCQQCWEGYVEYWECLGIIRTVYIPAVVLEAGRQFHLESHYIRRIVFELFPAFIALHRQVEIKRRRRCELIGLTQWNLVATGNILTLMELAILADHSPEVLTCAVIARVQDDMTLPQAAA